ncbi:MAG: hypothetical protein WDN47_00570 [Candidatus Doudnabacteria bacterium]
MDRTARRAFRILGIVLLALGLTDILRALIAHSLGFSTPEYDVAVMLIVAGLFMLNWKKEAAMTAIMLLAGAYLLTGTVWPKLNWSVVILSTIFLILMFSDRYDVWDSDQRIGRMNNPPQADPDRDGIYSEYPGSQ